MGCGGSKGAAFGPSAAPVDLSTPRQPPHGRETPHQPAAAEPAQQPPGAAEPGPAPGPASQEAYPRRRKSVEEARLRTLYELGALDQARKRQLDNLAGWGWAVSVAPPAQRSASCWGRKRAALATYRCPTAARATTTPGVPPARPLTCPAQPHHTTPPNPASAWPLPCSLVRGVLGVDGAFVLLIEAEQVVAAGSAVGQGWPTSVSRGGSVSKFMLRSDAPALLMVEDASLDPRCTGAGAKAGDAAGARGAGRAAGHSAPLEGLPMNCSRKPAGGGTVWFVGRGFKCKMGAAEEILSLQPACWSARRFMDAALVAGPPYARFIALAALVSHGAGLHWAGGWLRCWPYWPYWIRAASQVLAWGPGKQARASPAAKSFQGQRVLLYALCRWPRTAATATECWRWRTHGHGQGAWRPSRPCCCKSLPAWRCRSWSERRWVLGLLFRVTVVREGGCSTVWLKRVQQGVVEGCGMGFAGALHVAGVEKWGGVEIVEVGEAWAKQGGARKGAVLVMFE